MNQSDELNQIENYNSVPNYGSTTISNGSSSRKKRLCIDEAISKTGFGLFNYILIFTSALTMAAFIIEMIGISFIFPVSQCDLHLTSRQKGILGAAGYFGIICSSHLWGYLADTKGRRRVIQPTLFATFVVTVAASFVQNFYLLTILRFLTGFFISGSSATIYVYVGEFHNNSRRSKAIMGSSAVFGLICIVMPFLAWLVINQDWQYNVPVLNVTYKPWRLFLAMCSLPEFISFISITFLLPESPKFVLDQGKPNEAYDILLKMNHINNGKDAKLEAFEIYEDGESIENQREPDGGEKRKPISLMESISIQTFPLFQNPFLFRTVLICVIQFTVFFTCQGLNVFFTEISNRLAVNSNYTEGMMMCDILKMNPSYDIGEENGEVCITKLQTTTLLQELSLQILYASGYFIVSMLINKISKFPIIFSIFAGTGVCGIACMLTDDQLLQVCFFTVLQAGGVGSVALNTVTVELYPTKLRAMAICISLMLGRLGSVAGSNSVAYLLEENCQFTFYLCGVSLIVAGVLTYFIPNIHQKVIKSDKL